MKKRIQIGLGLAALAIGSGPAAAKDKSGNLVSWELSDKDGKGVGTERIRLVSHEGGRLFASGEQQLTGKKKARHKTHLQREGDGGITRYQRVAPGPRGAGFRFFAWKEGLRVAPVNRAGKAKEVGASPAGGYVYDPGIWHLFETWALPKSCQDVERPYLHAVGQDRRSVNLRCVGTKTLYNKKNAVEVHRFNLDGLGEELELWVSSSGGLIGAEGSGRRMLRAGWASAKTEKEAEVIEDDSETDAIRERGVGE